MQQIRLSALALTTFFLGCAATVSPASALEMTNRQVKIGKELTMSGAEKVAAKLFKLDAAGNEPILLIIGTRSGYAPAAMVVADAISAVKSDVYAVIQSEAFGVGAIVALFCARRYAFSHAAVLFTKLEYDSEKVMKDRPPLPAEAAEAYISRIYAVAAKRLNTPVEGFRTKAEKNWYLTAEEAKREGIVTEVVSKVTWVDLVVETVEVKRTSTTKRKRPVPTVKAQ